MKLNSGTVRHAKISFKITTVMQINLIKSNIKSVP